MLRTINDSINDFNALSNRVLEIKTPATDTLLGMVKIGLGISVTADGKISTNPLLLLISNILISNLNKNLIVLDNISIPIALKTNLGSIYPIEKGTLSSDNSSWYIDPTIYINYENLTKFEGPWTIYLAGGISKTMSIVLLSALYNKCAYITPLNYTVYIMDLTKTDILQIYYSDFKPNKCITFEVWIDMPLLPISFTLPLLILWITPSVPDFSIGNTRYVVIMRWDGTDLLANLAYTKELS